MAKEKCVGFAREKCLVSFKDARIRVAKGVLSSKGVGKLIGWGSVPVNGRNMWLMNQMGLIGGDLGNNMFLSEDFIKVHQQIPIYGEIEKRYIHDPLLPQVIYCTEDMITSSLWEAMHTTQQSLEEVKIAKSLPRICFLSGLSGEEMMMFIDSFPETKYDHILNCSLGFVEDEIFLSEHSPQISQVHYGSEVFVMQD